MDSEPDASAYLSHMATVQKIRGDAAKQDEKSMYQMVTRHLKKRKISNYEIGEKVLIRLRSKVNKQKFDTTEAVIIEEDRKNFR